MTELGIAAKLIFSSYNFFRLNMPDPVTANGCVRAPKASTYPMLLRALRVAFVHAYRASRAHLASSIQARTATTCSSLSLSLSLLAPFLPLAFVRHLARSHAHKSRM